MGIFSLAKWAGNFNISKHTESKNNGIKRNKNKAKTTKISRRKNRRKK